jgi:hypothetical protein
MQRLITLTLLLSVLAAFCFSSAFSPRSSAQILNRVSQYTAKIRLRQIEGKNRRTRRIFHHHQRSQSGNRSG